MQQENNLVKICSNLLNDSQYGFRHNRSTSFTLIKLNKEITSLLHTKLTTISMLIDLKKAFDRLDHNFLIKKAENMGWRGIVMNWIRSYLNNTKQYVEPRNN